MNCLQARRALLAAPREQSDEHRAHLVECGFCAHLLKRLTELERCLEEAALVPAPDALVHRILLPRCMRRVSRWAVAAGIAVATASIPLVASEALDTVVFWKTTQAVSSTHPAVVAIAEVAEETLSPAGLLPSDLEVEESFNRLGLTIKAGQAHVEYLGKCHIESNRDCDRVVLSAPGATANVMLMPDYSAGDRVLVQDRQMVALMSSAQNGTYIVVARNRKAARRIEKMFVRRG